MSFINENEFCCDNDSHSQMNINGSITSIHHHMSFFESEQWIKRHERVNVIFLVAEFIIMIIAILGNSLVIIVFIKNRKLRRKTNYYIVSLCFADFLVGIIGIPFCLLLVSTKLPSSNFLLCLLPISTLLTFCNISIFSLFLISIDRIFSINLPLNSTLNSTTKNVMLEIAFVWTSGIFVGFLPIFWHKVPLNDSCMLYNVLADGFQIFRFIFVILIPACTMFAIYCNIYRIIIIQLKNEAILKRPPISCCEKSKESLAVYHTSQRVLLKRELKATVNISLIIFIFIITWLPLHIVNLVTIFCKSCFISRETFLLVLAIAHSSSSLDPLIYAYHMRDIRKSILKLLGLQIPKTLNSRQSRNTFILIVFFKDKNLQKRKINFLFASQALADIFVASIGIPLILLLYTGVIKEYKLCTFTISTVIATRIIPINNIVAISYDRYKALSNSIQYAMTKPFKSKHPILLSWIFGIITGYLICFYNTGDAELECTFRKKITKEYMIILQFICTIIPLLIIFIIYTLVYIMMRKVYINHSCDECTSDSKILKKAKCKIRRKEFSATINMLAIVITFGVCKLPLLIIHLIYVFGNLQLHKDIHFTFIAINHLNALINPFLYSFFLKDFRTSCKKFLNLPAERESTAIHSSL
ncbi:hypothetical protein PVAND_010251 [Polypedilum vanderplanki]|uniref:G-protein coupled receptors family 1 profile domain-containing protein n=1 Tax=Polypedilum vanderplanki TaxID=319348 RepID=A0A9J6CFB2_POLVA|nr:hypothetical protein PVAND_010251 [Polypedilum vanderplanki]